MTSFVPVSRPNSRRTFLALFAFLASILAISPALSKDNDTAPLAAGAGLEASAEGPQVTPELIDSKIKEVEASSTLDPEAAKRLVEQYRAALSNLEEMRANEKRTTAFQDSITEAPAQTSQLRAETAALAKQAEDDTKPLAPRPSLAEVEQELAQQLAQITAIEAKLTELNKIVDDNIQEPNRARNRIIEANDALEEVNAKLASPADDGMNPLEREARKWTLQTRQGNLRAELLMLDQQILSASARTDLNLARRARAEEQLARLRAQRALLENEADRLRRIEADRVKTETAAAEQSLSNAHPLVRELARDNANLSESISRLTDQLDQLDERQSELADRRRRIEESYRSARQRFEAAGLSRALGQSLVTERRQLPDLRSLNTEAANNADDIGKANQSVLSYRDQLRGDDQLNGRIRAAIAAAAPAEREELSQRLHEQLDRRNELLQGLINIDESYLRGITELDDEMRGLIRAVQEYQSFLDERLLWERNVAPITEQYFTDFPRAVAWLAGPSNWLPLPGVLLHQLKTSPVYWIGIALFLGLLWKTPALQRRIRADGEPLRRVSTDKFSYTLDALGTTLVLALTWPLLIALTGWQLESSSVATPFSQAVGHSLTAIGIGLYYLRAFYLLSKAGGIADRHFRWSSHAITCIRRNFHAATLVLPIIGFIAGTTVMNAEQAYSGTLGRLAMVVLILAVTVFTMRLTNPRNGAFRDILKEHPHSWFCRLRMLWYSVLILVPLSLAVLALAGYLYTAGVLLRYLFSELWLLLGLIVVQQLIVRWLMVTRRALTLDAALEEQPQRTEEPTDVANLRDQKVDLAALDEQTRRLINSMLVIAGAVGLWLIWADVLPALGVLDRVHLWYHTGTVDGAQGQIPVTLADLGLLGIIVLIALIAGKNLPALLEIILLKHTEVSSGMRYTIIKLTSYVIIAIAVLSVFSTLGLSWSQLQWLIAALSVGIGFGLQEIVANFISGLILLFERPIRVGDVVTIGDTTGMVSRIQIRATTIRNWDKQELLVPNKEFITGRLLNWTLTDTLNRITIVVGAEYGCDTRKALALLAEVAAENPRILTDPEPVISFEGFGDNSLNLVLRCYLAALDYRLAVITELHQAIDDKFRAAGIGIAFPQRDIHLHADLPIPIAMQRPARGDASLAEPKPANPQPNDA